MNKENFKNSKKSISRKDTNEIDIHNDKIMIELGLRQPTGHVRDISVWTKTPNEKRILNKVKYSNFDGYFHSVPRQIIPVRGKLIVYLSNNTVYPKTTYSIECWQHEIPRILSEYTVVDKKKSNKDKIVTKNVVLKYSWNDKTYKSIYDLPFWK